MANNPAMLGIITFGPAAARLGRRALVKSLVKEGLPKREAMAKAGFQRSPYGIGVETRGDAFLMSTAGFGSLPAGYLSEVADVHPDLETAYPGISRSLRVEVVPDNAWKSRVEAARRALALWAKDGDTSSGFYDRGNNLIAVRAQMPGESLKGYLDRADGTLVHELQHYAQRQDGLRPPRRHIDDYDYKVDGLEVEARNSAARRKLSPAERAELPREMTQDVKPADVRQDVGGGIVRNDVARVSAPAPRPQFLATAQPWASPELTLRSKSSYEMYQDSLREKDSAIHGVIDSLPGRPLRNTARALAYGAARFGVSGLRLLHDAAGPIRLAFGDGPFKFNGFKNMADAVEEEIERHPYEYDPEQLQLAPVLEGATHLGLSIWLGNKVSGWSPAAGRATLPALFAADAKHKTLHEMEEVGLDPESPINQLAATARGAFTAAAWSVPIPFLRSAGGKTAAQVFDRGALRTALDRMSRPAAELYVRSAGDSLAGSGVLYAAHKLGSIGDTRDWWDRMPEELQTEYEKEVQETLASSFDPQPALREIDSKYEARVIDLERRQEIQNLTRYFGSALQEAHETGLAAAVQGGSLGAFMGSRLEPSRPVKQARQLHQDTKGGDNFGTFRNFLATDDVPESIFGIPVVQDESQYTEKDLKFFKENPEAAGFYDLGDEEVDEDVPQQAAKSKPSRGAYPGSLNNPGNVEKRKERRQGEVDSPSERFAKFATPQDGLREMADVVRQIAAVKLAEKGLPFTIRNFAGVYAPGTENDTARYIADISADSGFDPDTELHRFDEGDMAKFLKSVVRFESGYPHSQWFTDDEYNLAAKVLQKGAVD